MAYIDPDAQREYQRHWRDRRRQEWLASHGSCAKCGSRENLQIDHKEPKLKISHRIWSWSKERLEAELAKCQILCQKCHIEKSVEEKRKPTEHGTHKAYANGCRCSDCRQAQRDYMQIWRQASIA